MNWEDICVNHGCKDCSSKILSPYCSLCPKKRLFSVLVLGLPSQVGGGGVFLQSDWEVPQSPHGWGLHAGLSAYKPRGSEEMAGQWGRRREGERCRAKLACQNGFQNDVRKTICCVMTLETSQVWGCIWLCLVPDSQPLHTLWSLLWHGECSQGLWWAWHWCSLLISPLRKPHPAWACVQPACGKATTLSASQALGTGVPDASLGVVLMGVPLGSPWVPWATAHGVHGSYAQ